MRLLFVLLIATAANAAEVTRVGMWELHNSFWMNLHQTLMHEATARTPRDLAALTQEQRDAWNAAVAAYRAAHGGRGNITFTEAMSVAQDELAQVADDAVNPSIHAPLAAVLKQAAPVYRAHWWAADEAANRFFISYAAGMLRDAGEELARAHEKVYREQFPKTLRVDVTAHAGPFGAYTGHRRDTGWIVTMSSRDPGYQGLRALEMLLHESSHSIIGPNHGSVARAINSTSRRLGIPPPPDLWHAVLFATTSRLAVRALADRGVTKYDPSAEDLLTRVWPRYREPIEKYWYPYLDGTGTLEETMGKIVEAVR